MCEYFAHFGSQSLTHSFRLFFFLFTSSQAIAPHRSNSSVDMINYKNQLSAPHTTATTRRVRSNRRRGGRMMAYRCDLVCRQRITNQVSAQHTTATTRRVRSNRRSRRGRTVSYTHLDVYKRQIQGCMRNIIIRMVDSVSYTHLDVYKRQP